jgi:hypothetical protein
MHVLTRHDTRPLRHFGLGFAVFVVLVFWGLLPWLGDHPRPVWPLVAAGVLVLAALAWPPSILPLYRLWLPVARAIGFINTWVLLGAVFFGILLPIGLVLRSLGRLQYRSGLQRELDTYRVEVAPGHQTRLEEPF